MVYRKRTVKRKSRKRRNDGGFFGLSAPPMDLSNVGKSISSGASSVGKSISSGVASVGKSISSGASSVYEKGKKEIEKFNKKSEINKKYGDKIEALKKERTYADRLKTIEN